MRQVQELIKANIRMPGNGAYLFDNEWYGNFTMAYKFH